MRNDRIRNYQRTGSVVGEGKTGETKPEGEDIGFFMINTEGKLVDAEKGYAVESATDVLEKSLSIGM